MTRVKDPDKPITYGQLRYIAGLVGGMNLKVTVEFSDVDGTPYTLRDRGDAEAWLDMAIKRKEEQEAPAPGVRAVR